MIRTLQSTPTVGHDVGELLDPLVDGAEVDENDEGQTERTRPTRLDILVALGKKRGTTRWELAGPQKNGIRARFVAREFKSDEMMNDVFAPSSIPSTGRIIECFES